MRFKSWFINILLLAIVTAVFWFISRSESPQIASSYFGVSSSRPTPTWELPLLSPDSPSSSSQTISSKQFDKGIVFINFWASWCEACRQEEPEIEKLWEHYGKQSLPMVGIASMDNREAVFKTGLVGKIFPIALDESGAVLASFNGNSLPQSFLLDSEGRVIMHFKEAITERDRISLELKLQSLGLKARG